jgi:hypothetical protein
LAANSNCATGAVSLKDDTPQISSISKQFQFAFAKEISNFGLLCLRILLSQILCFSFYVTEPFRLNTETAFFMLPEF